MSIKFFEVLTLRDVVDKLFSFTSVRVMDLIFNSLFGNPFREEVDPRLDIIWRKFVEAFDPVCLSFKSSIENIKFRLHLKVVLSSNLRREPDRNSNFSMVTE
jgi:hypothetical protein